MNIWESIAFIILINSNRIPYGGISKKMIYVYFLLQVFSVILWYKCCSDATMVTWCHNSTIWRHNSSTMATINRKYTWLLFPLFPNGYSIWGTENWDSPYVCTHKVDLTILNLTATMAGAQVTNDTGFPEHCLVIIIIIKIKASFIDGNHFILQWFSKGH